MSEYLIFYTLSTVVCVSFFAVLLIHDLFSVDRQEKQIKYDRALVAFMLYFIADNFWAAVKSGAIPRTMTTVLLFNTLDSIFMAYIIYAWLQYVMAVERVPGRNSRKTRFIAALPLIISVIATILMYIFTPQLLIDSNLQTTTLSSISLIIVPIIYIAAVLFYSLRKAFSEKDPVERRHHYFVGFFPLMVVAGGLLQIIVLPDAPIFFFASALLMLIFYIQEMDGQISLDPLTGLNNRGQLHRYISQESNMRREGRRTFVIMLDVNDFKLINDNYGHAEGDHALVIISQALKKAIAAAGMPLFLARYGGDEFILIVHPAENQDPEKVVTEIRRCLEAECRNNNLPYMISISAGTAQLTETGDSYQLCMERADKDLYEDKARQKSL